MTLPDLLTIFPRAFPIFRARAGVAQLVEHLICNEVVGGSSPFASSVICAGFGRRLDRPPASHQRAAQIGFVRSCGHGWWCGGVPERPKGADCKSAGSRLRRFESFPLHQLSNARHCAGIAQRLEHRPSKPRVAGSNPVSRSILHPVNFESGKNSSLPRRGRRILRNGSRPAPQAGIFPMFRVDGGGSWA